MTSPSQLGTRSQVMMVTVKTFKVMTSPSQLGTRSQVMMVTVKPSK
jgi:hypothetical protein